MPPPSPTFLDFAALCEAVYDASVSTVAGFTRFNDTRRWSGFQGAIYRKPTGKGLLHVVAFAGTQLDKGDAADVLADVGFGGSLVGTLAGSVGPALGPLGGPGLLASLLSAAGQALLSQQCASAEELLDIASATAGPNDRILLTGHSLGGGIAQIVAARRGVPAVAISAPAVTAVEGVAAAWTRSKAPIACLQVRNDPINQTVHLGGWLGRCFLLPSPRTGLAAHSIAGTRAELSPQGPFSTLGARDPFAP